MNGIKPNRLFIMKSNPGGEGAELSKSLLVESMLIDDMEGMELILSNKVNVIMVGCDSYSPMNWFVNKVGTSPISKLAINRDIPVYILTSQLKKAISPYLGGLDMYEIIEWQSNFHLITDQDRGL